VTPAPGVLIRKRGSVPEIEVENSGYYHRAVKGKRVIGPTSLPFFGMKEKKRRRPVVVLKVLRVLKVLGARKTALALGFRTFWCTDMGLLVCSYGMTFWCANLLLYLYTV
jgi:hypothetical protein